MGLGEWVLVFGLLGLSGGTFVYLTRRRKSIISSSIQAEIDQTPEWWDNEFRKLQGLPGIPFSNSEIEGWKAAGITEVWDGDFHYSFKHLVDIAPPTVDEIWSPGPDSNYDLSIDLAVISSTIQKALEKNDD